MSSVGVLALWKRWYRSDGELTDDSAMFAAALAALNIMGATLSVLWLVLPHPGAANEGVIVAATLAAYVLGTFLVLGPRKPWWMFQVSIALDTLVISVALVATGDAGSVYAFYYLWATLYAVCFFGRRQIALQTAWVCAAYAGSLALIGGEPTALLSQWLLPMATLLAAGALVRQLTGRLRRSEAILRHDAGHDPLTGLPNRALFGERLADAVAEAQPVTVVFIDLDHFKRVNDSLGHTVGDALLVAVAERLRRRADEHTLLARFGGDEFLALIRAPAWEPATRALLDAFSRPFTIGEYAFGIGASLGIATARAGEDAHAVLSNADAALYHAKNEGRGRPAIFDDSMRIAVSDRLHLENELRTALDTDALEVAYQPIVRLSDGATTGAEALARWTHTTLGPVAPDVFIAVAEETGLIDALGERVLARACRDATAWIEAIPDFRLSVNLSPCQLRAADFVPRLERVLAESGLPHRNLTLEVTESAVLSMDTRTRENLDRLVRSGIGLALDDFGIGHSSLSQLRRVPFDVIKIDRSFMIDRSPTGDAIIGAVASIGLATGARVLAEGIENAEHDDRAQRLGCGYGQGWHFGRPVPAAELACHIGVLRLAPATEVIPSRLSA